MKPQHLLLALLVLAFSSACGGPPPSPIAVYPAETSPPKSPSPIAAYTRETPTVTATGTSTPTLSRTPRPTTTRAATFTPAPTDTPEPSRTPTATLEPLPPDWTRVYGFEVVIPDPIVGLKSDAGIVLRHAVPYRHTDPCNRREVTTLSELTDFYVRLEVLPLGFEDARLTVGPFGPEDTGAVFGPLTGGGISYGAEGCGQDVYLFPLSPQKTLWVVRKWVAEFSPIIVDYEKHLALPGIIPPEEADRLFEEILSSFRLTGT